MRVLRSSVSGLIDRAAKRGLIQRSGSSDDGRAVRVSLTAEGHALADQLTDAMAALLAPVTGNLPPADQKRLATLLTKLLV